jgi:hypothetical protein
MLFINLLLLFKMNTSGIYHFHIYSKFLGEIYKLSEEELLNTSHTESVLLEISQQWLCATSGII